MPIFLDLKLHDIPNTVAKAVAALAPIAPAILTVHAAGGHEMLRAAKTAASPNTKVVAVTLLTSLDAGDLSDLGIKRSPADQVARLAWVARDSGVDGIVCSGAEVAAARNAWPRGFFVVPGLRPPGADTGDQKRVVTPARALDDGASVLVVLFAKAKLAFIAAGLLSEIETIGCRSSASSSSVNLVTGWARSSTCWVRTSDFTLSLSNSASISFLA